MKENFYEDVCAQDERFMREALKEAVKAYEKDEVPVGAVLVMEGRVIARGHNQVELLQDATAHAEMLCLTAGASQLNNWRLTGATLYCTLEPCCMCAGALISSRVARLVWGAKDVRVGANGSWIDVFAEKHPIHTMEVGSGVLEAQAADLLKSFFQQKRKNERGRNSATTRTHRGAEKDLINICSEDCAGHYSG